MSGKRRRFKAQEKFSIVKEVITKTKTISVICDEYNIHTNQYYKWQRDFYEAALNGFNEKARGRTRVTEERVKNRLKEEISKMKDVITEVVKENIDLKKKDME